jgi:hypothetical protein
VSIQHTHENCGCGCGAEDALVAKYEELKRDSMQAKVAYAEDIRRHQVEIQKLKRTRNELATIYHDEGNNHEAD